MGGARALGDAAEFFVEQATHFDELFAYFDRRRMARTQRRARIGFKPDDLRHLAAQAVDRGGLERVAGAIRHAAAFLDRLNLIECRLGLGGAALGLDDALVEFAELLLADELALDAEDAVLDLVGLDPGFGLLQTALQVLEMGFQPGLLALRGFGFGILAIREVGPRDGIGDACRFRRILRPDLDLDDIGPVRPANLERFLEIGKHIGGGIADTAREFGVVEQLFRLDHAAQHRVGFDEHALAVDKVGVIARAGARAFDLEARAVARIDEDRGGSRVKRFCQQGISQPEGCHQRGRGRDRLPAAPEDLPEFGNANRRFRTIDRGRPAFPRARHARRRNLRQACAGRFRPRQPLESRGMSLVSKHNRPCFQRLREFGVGRIAPPSSDSSSHPDR